MADFDTNDRASRFDRADFGARQVLPQRQRTQRLLQALAPPAAGADDGLVAIAVSEPDPTDDSSIEAEETKGAPNPSGDEQLTAEHLKSAGWSQAEIQTILSGPGHPDAPGPGRAASQAQVEAHLRALGWTNSDIARLLVGPEESHLTAESVFRQHAANPAAHQEVLVKAMAQSGAKKVQTDPSLLAGLDAAHLGAGNPADVEQIIARFAELPDVQKQRFLLLLGSQNQDKSKKANPDGSSSKKSDAGSDILPIVKGGLDLLNTTLKELLGSTKGGSKKDKKGGSGSTNNWYEDQDNESDQGDGGDQGNEGGQGDQDGSYEGTDDSEEDPALTGEEWDSSSPSDGSEPIDFDSETGID